VAGQVGRARVASRGSRAVIGVRGAVGVICRVVAIRRRICNCVRGGWWAAEVFKQIGMARGVHVKVRR
jgi:hypothetical protein